MRTLSSLVATKAAVIATSSWFSVFNTLKPRQNGRNFADDVFKCIFLSGNLWISIKISRNFVPWGAINNNPEIVQRMAWRQSGDKPLFEPLLASLLTHICVTWQFMTYIDYWLYCLVQFQYTSSEHGGDYHGMFLWSKVAQFEMLLYLTLWS